jgi:hypothetical protein
MNFQEHPSSGSQDTAKKAHCCSCEVSLIIDQSGKNAYFLGHAFKVRGTNFEKMPPMAAEMQLRSAMYSMCP